MRLSNSASVLEVAGQRVALLVVASLKEFCDYLLNKKGFSEVTIRGYRVVLQKFLREVPEPDKDAAERYLLRMKKQDYSYSHVRNTIVIIRRYMNFLEDPIDVEQPRRPDKLPAKEILTVGEIARLLAATKNVRERAMISILAYTGLRNKEVCNLKVKNVDLGSNLVKVINGKFSKDRTVPMTQDCAATLTKYLSEYPRNRENWLFTTLDGDRRYNGTALRDRVKSVAERTSIEKNVHPHIFRHSFITHLIDNGANITAVKKFAGHSRLETTLQYTHLSPRSMQRQYLFYMPNYS